MDQKKNKNKKSPTKKNKASNKEEIGKKLNLRQDLFCQYFVKNSELRGNATLCYAEAYGYDLDSMSTENEKVQEWDEKLEAFKEVVKIGTSERARAEMICANSAHFLLRNPKVNDYIVKLYNELLRDDVVDSRLASWIMQDKDPSTSIAAIREYNKLKKRITDLLEVKRPLEDMTDEELAETQKEARRLLTKQ